MRGVMPEILEELFSKRLDAKKKMKACDGAERDYWDAQQYALKILMNSMYGFAGYITQLYPMEIGSAAIQLGRDALMLDALAEEVLYRALIIQLMGLCWTREVGFGRVQLTQAAWLSIPIFALSHVQVSFFPFRIIGYDPIQLGLTVLTGFIFAYAYEKTQALVLPILIHGYTNLIITITAYAIVIIK